MTNFRFRLFLILFLLFGTGQSLLQAQQSLGVVWKVPANPDSARNQLHQFEEMGISAIEIDQLPPRGIWTQIDSIGFEVYANLGIHFPITRTFKQPDTTLIRDIQQKSRTYLSQPSVKAIGLFNYGNVYKSTFWQAVSPFAEEIKQTSGIQLYHKNRTAAQTDTTIIHSAIITVPIKRSNYESPALPTEYVMGYVYRPSATMNNLLTPFKHFLTTVGESQNSNATIFVEANWLTSIIQKHPQFKNVLLSLTSESVPVFPLPREQMPTSRNTAFPIIALFVIWLTVGLHYNMSPLYRKSLFRYFIAHKFFIDDIFKRLIRSSMPAIIILIQNALLISLAAYSAFSTVFTPLGQEAFFYHFPNLSIIGNSALSILVWFFAGMMLLSLLGIIWLYLTHKKINSITQIATVYAWPLQLNLIFCTIAVTFVSTSGSFSTILFTTLALLLALLAFVITALDLSRFSRSKLKYNLKTVIPYILLITFLLGWAISKDEWIEIVTLALNLT